MILSIEGPSPDGSSKFIKIELKIIQTTMDMTGNEYAVMNLRTIKQNIGAYTSYAENAGYSPIYEKMEAAQQAVQELIDTIENDNS